MPQFSYSALDSTGRSVQGVLDASTENEMIVRLSGQGLRVQSINKSGAAPAMPMAQRRQVSPSIQARPLAKQSPTIETAQATQINPPTRSPVVEAIRTRRLSYSGLHFLFTQLGNLLRSGINPATALNDLAQRQTKPHIRFALQHMATLTTEGRSLSEAMAVYPDIFPPGSVGTVKAGEAGGYMWQACESLSEQNNQAHKMAWAVRVFRWVAVLGLFAIPMTNLMTNALERSFAGMSGLSGYVQGAGQELVGPIGIVMLCMVLVYWSSAWWLRRSDSRLLRHRLGTKVPIFSRRAKVEALAAFNWHLSKLSEAGLPPSTAWKLAASALPNEEFASRMEEIGQTVMDKNRLTDLVRRSGIYPFEYVGLIETGEMAGNLPGALDQASRLASEDLKLADKVSRISLYGAYLALFAVIAVICCATFYSGYFNSLYKHTVGETENE